MKVESLEAIPYTLPFREPYVTSRGRLLERDLLLVRARSDGLEGWGETAALSLRGGAGIAEVAAEVQGACREALTDGGFDPHRIWSALARCRNRGAGAPALAAVDIALHDLAGQAEGVPVWKLLGADAASPVVCNATLPVANPTTLRELAERWAADGFRTFKLKMGLASDMAQIATIRSVLGPEAKIRIDANGAWNLDDATEKLRALGRHNVELAEEPVAGLEQMARCEQDPDPAGRRRERRRPRDARRAVELGACSLAAVKLAKVGGIAEALPSPTRSPSTSPAPSRARSASPPRPTAPRRSQSTRRQPASRTASRRSASSPRRSGGVPRQRAIS